MKIKEHIEQAQARIKERKAKIKDAGDYAAIAAMLTKDETEKKIADSKGNLVAAQENVRIASERRQSKFNSEMIKAQMTMDAAKKAIADKKEAVDKVKRASRIDDLITYAECCEAMAVQMLIEADIAMLTAAAEAADYVDTYGEEAELSE